MTLRYLCSALALTHWSSSCPEMCGDCYAESDPALRLARLTAAKDIRTKLVSHLPTDRYPNKHTLSFLRVSKPSMAVSVNL